MDESTSKPTGVLRPFSAPGRTPPTPPPPAAEPGPTDAFAGWPTLQGRPADVPIAGVDPAPSEASRTDDDPPTAEESSSAVEAGANAPVPGDWIPEALLADAVTDAPSDELQGGDEPEVAGDTGVDDTATDHDDVVRSDTDLGDAEPGDVEDSVAEVSVVGDSVVEDTVPEDSVAEDGDAEGGAVDHGDVEEGDLDDSVVEPPAAGDGDVHHTAGSDPDDRAADDDGADNEDRDDDTDDRTEFWDADDEHAPGPVAPAGDTITLPRTLFLIGAGAVAVAVVALLVLWRTAGGDTVVEAGDPLTGDDAETAGNDVTDVDPDAPQTAREDELEGQLTEARAEAAALAAEIDLLEARPEPPVDAGQMRRVVVGADAKFVSASDELVAVVGPFGGLSLIDPATDRVVVNASVGSNATRVMLTPTAAWITDYADSLVLRVDPVTGQVVSRFPFLGPDGITKDGDSLVVASFDGNIVGRIEPTTGELLQQVEVGGSPTAVHSDATYGLWAAVFDTGEIVQIDQTSFGIRQRIVVGAGPVGITSDGTHLYVANNGEGTVAKVDPFTGSVVWTVAVGEEPTEVVVVDDAAWVTVTGEGSLVQLDLETGEVLSRTPLGGAVAGGGPTGISYGAGALWVAMQGEQSVQKVEL